MKRQGLLPSYFRLVSCCSSIALVNLIWLKLIDAYVVSGQAVFGLALLLARSADAFDMHYVLGCFDFSVISMFTTSLKKCCTVLWSVSALVKLQGVSACSRHVPTRRLTANHLHGARTRLPIPLRSRKAPTTKHQQRPHTRNA